MYGMYVYAVKCHVYMHIHMWYVYIYMQCSFYVNFMSYHSINKYARCFSFCIWKDMLLYILYITAFLTSKSTLL